MNIQSPQGINFGATRVLSTYSKQSVVDILKLDINNQSDVRFAKKCSQTIAKEYKHRHPSNNTQKKPQLQKFFNKFLRSQMPNFNGDYYVAIKDGEKILGGFSSYPYAKSTVLEPPILKNRYKAHIDSMLYSALSDINKESTSLSRADSFRFPERVIDIKNASKIKTKIRKQHPTLKFDDKKVKNVNLEEYFGINDIEEQILG